jgi:hypothetical protein
MSVPIILAFTFRKIVKSFYSRKFLQNYMLLKKAKRSISINLHLSNFTAASQHFGITRHAVVWADVLVSTKEFKNLNVHLIWKLNLVIKPLLV